MASRLILLAVVGLAHAVPALQVRLVGLQVLGGLGREPLALGLAERHAELRDDLGGDLRLDREDVLDRPVVGAGPHLGVVGGSHQLGGDAHAAARASVRAQRTEPSRA